MGSPTLTLPNNMFRRSRSRGRGDVHSEHEVPVKSNNGTRASSINKRGVNRGGGDSFANLRTLFRLASKHGNGNTNSNNNTHGGHDHHRLFPNFGNPRLSSSTMSTSSRRRQPRRSRSGGANNRSSKGDFSQLRRSTSTHFTRSTTNRSSAFLEPFTMDDFLMAGELAAFGTGGGGGGGGGESKEEINDIDDLDGGNDYINNSAEEYLNDTTTVTQFSCTCKTIEEGIEKAESQSFGSGTINSSSSNHFNVTTSISSNNVDIDGINNPLHMQQQQQQQRPESSFEMTKNEYEELGNIKFEFRSLREAQEESFRRGMPILCIEAEVPGDIEAGQTIFSHPLVVEAAESRFVTVHPWRRRQRRHSSSLSYEEEEPQDESGDEDEDDNNNKDDEKENRDRRFFRSSTFRTRVRILDDKGIDVLAPIEHMSMAEVVSALVRGLESYRTRVPQYLKLLLEEEAGKLQVLSKTRFRNIQGEAIFGMFDSITAEVEFGGLDGVLSTRSGALVRDQVVRVTYDSRRLTYGALVRHALRKAGVNVVYYETNDERIAAQLEVQHFHDYRLVQQRYADPQLQDNKKQRHQQEQESSSSDAIKVTEIFGNIRTTHCFKPALRSSILRFVPLTNLQSTRANRLIHYHKFDEAMHLLSPRQGLIAMQALRAHHSKHFQDVVDVPICNAWNDLLGMTADNKSSDNQNGCGSSMLSSPLIKKLHYVVTRNDDDSTESLSLTDVGAEVEPLPLMMQ